MTDCKTTQNASPAMPPNFQKNGLLLHEIHVFEVSMPRYAKTRFVKVGPFVASSHKFILKFPKFSADFPKT